MEYEQDARVPRITHTGHPYMVDLYERSGAGDGTDPQRVLHSAELAWNNAGGVGDRVEAAELLLGQRIDGGQIGALPGELTSAIFDGGQPFEIAVRGIARTIDLYSQD